MSNVDEKRAELTRALEGSLKFMVSPQPLEFAMRRHGELLDAIIAAVRAEGAEDIKYQRNRANYNAGQALKASDECAQLREELAAASTPAPPTAPDGLAEIDSALSWLWDQHRKARGHTGIPEDVAAQIANMLSRVSRRLRIPSLTAAEATARAENDADRQAVAAAVSKEQKSAERHREAIRLLDEAKGGGR
jgi:hypothetical protein